MSPLFLRSSLIFLMPAYSTEHNRIQTRQLLYRYFVRSTPIILSFVLIIQTLDIELVFLQSHLDNFALLNPASIFFAVSIELHDFQYKAWQMTSSDDDSTILQEGLSGSSDQSMYLNNLAISLQARLKQQGALSDLDEAIELYRVVLPFRSPGHPGRSTTLNKLAISLHDRWRRRLPV